METQSYAGLAHTLQTVAIATLVFAVFALIPKFDYQLKLSKLPIFGGTTRGEKQRQIYLKSGKQMYHDGYKKFKDSVYRIASYDGEDDVLVPLSLLPELKKLPDNILSFPKAVEEMMEARYTGLLTESPVVVHSIKGDLTPVLGRLTDIIRDEVEISVNKHMPPCEDWTEVWPMSALVDIVAQVSGRVFVGPELCRDPEYLACATNYTMDLVTAVSAIKRLRPWLRPFLASRLPEILKLREREDRARKCLEPIIHQRRNAEKNDPDWQKPNDMLQWMATRITANGAPLDMKSLVDSQLGLIFAAIHTTSMTTTNILYCLAVTPEYVGPLREEIRSVMAEHNGELSTRALQQMTKLDSYMKEVIRHYGSSITSFNRRVLKSFTLSNGQHIPKGVTISVPSSAMYVDSEIYPDGDKFDGFRHYNLRLGGSASDQARNQFVTTNEHNTVFGYGNHACPGRFFAANEIKVIVARLILDFDIKMPDGLTERYPQIVSGKNTSPDPTKKLLFRKVQI